MHTIQPTLNILYGISRKLFYFFFFPAFHPFSLSIYIISLGQKKICPKLGFFWARRRRENAKQGCKWRGEGGGLVSRASAAKSLHPCFRKGSKQEISSGRMAGIRFCLCGHPSSLFSLSPFSGAECLKPVKWAALPPPSSLFCPRDLSISSLSPFRFRSLYQELGRRGFSSLMASSFSPEAPVGFFGVLSARARLPKILIAVG